ncbi:MAG: tRNA (adenosine(37)-N6)-threonylcarbamoyltransferase complex ATPase subunit type 1 TsaE [Bacteroidota bacterium]|nr:tRNA (adenosine(37)-N6)-threonylcarbamoyltransferase complex ATPase subunit type 1 TsaE [Bacteroidota bacterium]
MNKKFKISSVKELDEVAKAIAKMIPSNKIFTLNGELGSGKTTLIKQILEKFEIFDSSSPTFSIINNYMGGEVGEVLHIDGYRIEKEEEVENLGFIDYLKDEPLCFIEWPEKFLNFLPKKHVNISIIVEEQYRIITISI